jgi:chitodextrinase
MVYTFFMRAFDTAGNASEFSNALYVVTLPPPDFEAPTAPSNLAATHWNGSAFTLTWSGATDNVMVTNYRVYRNGQLLPAQWPIPGVPNNPFPPLSYQVTNMPENTAVTFTVTAIDRAGNESAASASFSVTYVPKDTTAPTVPNGLIASNITTSGFRVTWNAATDNIAVTGYNVYRNGTYIATVPATTRNYTLSGLAANTTYSITVLAYDAVKNRSAMSTALSVKTLSNVILPDTQVPTVPSGLSSTNVTTSGFVVSWNTSTDNVAVTGYNIYRNGTYIATVSAATRNYSFTGLAANTTYNITVLAYDAAKNRSAQSTALSVKTLSNVVLPDTQAPTVPNGLSSANVTTSGFVVSWNASTDNVAVTGYNVYRNGAYVTSLSGSVRNYTFSGLTANTTYNITVLAYDATKNRSAMSAILAVKTL